MFSWSYGKTLAARLATLALGGVVPRLPQECQAMMTHHGVSMGQTETPEEREAALKQGKVGTGPVRIPPTIRVKMRNGFFLREHLEETRVFPLLYPPKKTHTIHRHDGVQSRSVQASVRSKFGLGSKSPSRRSDPGQASLGTQGEAPGPNCWVQKPQPSVAGRHDSGLKRTHPRHRQAVSTVIGTRDMGTGFNRLMTIQVPMKQSRSPPMGGGLFGSPGPFQTFGATGMDMGFGPPPAMGGGMGGMAPAPLAMVPMSVPTSGFSDCFGGAPQAQAAAGFGMPQAAASLGGFGSAAGAGRSKGYAAQKKQAGWWFQKVHLVRFVFST